MPWAHCSLFASWLVHCRSTLSGCIISYRFATAAPRPIERRLFTSADPAYLAYLALLSGPRAQCPIDTAAANHSNQPVGSSKSDMRLSIWGPSFPPPRDRPARAIQTRNPGVSGCLRSQDGCVWVCRGGSHLCTVPSRIGAEHYLTRRGAFGPKPHFLGGGSYVQWPARSDITAVFYALACSRI